MIICDRSKANNLLTVESNLFKNDERNIIPESSTIMVPLTGEVIEREEVRPVQHGRGAGRENLTDDQRKIIAEEALVSGKTIQEIAEQYGVSASSVSAYSNGVTSTKVYNEKKNESLESHIKETKEIVQAEAQNKLLLAIRNITDEKIGGAKVRDIAGIAKDMSAVIKNMGPETIINDNRKVILYKPRQKEEDEYEVVEVSS